MISVKDNVNIPTLNKLYQVLIILLSSIIILEITYNLIKYDNNQYYQNLGIILSITYFVKR